MLQTQIDPTLQSSACEVRLSICIVNWNTCDFLYACFRSIQKSQNNVPFEVIVIDNASQDGSATMLQLMFPKVKKIINNDNIGYAAANNQAMGLAQGEYILLLNPDTVIPDRVFDVLIEKMDADPSIGVISCQLRNPDGSIQRFCSGLPNIKDELFLQSGLDRRYPEHCWAGHRMLGYFDYTLQQDVEQPPGTFLFVRKSVIEDVGGFDEQFPIFFNDVDWCKRILDAGWRIVFTPDTYIFHHKSASVKKQLDKSLTDAFYMRKKYYRKHFGAIFAYLLSQFAPLGKTSGPIMKKFDEVDPKGPFLLIKSSYDAHFDLFIKTLREKFPSACFDILTVKAEDRTRYGNLCRHCFIYVGSSNWISIRQIDMDLLGSLRKSAYKGVFFPHATVDGAGYWNIVFFACALNAGIAGAFGIDGVWHLFNPKGFKKLKGFFVYGAACLLLLTGYVLNILSCKKRS